MSLEKPEVCIIGAGMSGLLMGIRLKAAGIHTFRIFEKASSVGGTWRENRYPGLSCDVPSFYYSYSFEANPDWSHRFAHGPEIRAYLERVAEKYELLPHIQFGTLITGARHDSGRWVVETSDGETITADILITACGPLHQKRYPEIEGMESFEGAQFHSADWDDDLDLDGKLHELDVIVLATGFDAHAFGVEQIIGEHGLSLREAWAKGDRAHRSVAFPHFPNYFTLVGPNSPVGNLSLIDVAETQTNYIMEFIKMFQQGRFSEDLRRPDLSEYESRTA